MDNYQTLVENAKQGFATLDLPQDFKDSALQGVRTWLGDETFSDYAPQIAWLISEKKWDFLLDAFYQVIPFGTGGRRGLVGIGPNRINPWTIQASAQGHSQYLIKQYGDEAGERGVVLAYDVRKYTEKGVYDDSKPNPVMDLDCKQLAVAAARVYAANGIKVYLFDGVRSTPELSFAIRYLNAISGDVFSASHNLPTDNGKKVYDQFGGQLIPPFDQILVDEVTQNTADIKKMDAKSVSEKGLIQIVGKEIDEAYHKAVATVSLSGDRDIRILYSPLHGTGITSVYPVLKHLGFDIRLDLATKNLSGAFENVTFNIPNPEVIQSFDSSLKAARDQQADLIISTDPDADRIGVMALHKGEYRFLNGNEIGVILTEYAISRFRDENRLNENSMIIKTDVTTSLITDIALKNNVNCMGDLLVGFKYIGEQMNRIEKKGLADDFILGTEESHGYIMGNYCRDKDAASAAVWIAELAAGLKKDNQTLVDYLDRIYATYGYCHNYLTEIRLLGAKGIGRIASIMKHLRETAIDTIGSFGILEKTDRYQGEPQPHLSKTDTSSRNVLVLKVDNLAETKSIKITVRPSGTEPKFKIYFEVFGKPFSLNAIQGEKEKVTAIREKLEKAFMDYCYKILGVDFPARGYLLFWQLPLDDKLKYLEIEPEIAALKAVADRDEREKQLFEKLDFLGANPVEKVDLAFREKYEMGLLGYLDLD